MLSSKVFRILIVTLLFTVANSVLISAQNWELDSLRWQEYYLTGYNLYRVGNLDSAEYYFSECEKIAVNNDQPYFLYKSKFAIGSSMIARSNYDSADKIYERAFQEIPRDIEKTQELLGFVFLGKGLVHYRKLQYDGAIFNYKKARAYREDYFGFNHVETGKTYANIGMAYELIGGYDSSIFYQKKAIDIFTKILGPEHEYVGRMSHNIGITYHFAGESNKAIEFLANSVRIRENAHGRIHPQVATSLEFMGSVFHDLGKYEAADSVYNESIDIRNALDVNQSLRDIGGMYQRLSLNAAIQKDSVKAFEYANSAREALRVSVGENDANYLIGLVNEAEIHKEFGQYQQSISLINEFQEKVAANQISYTSQLLLSYTLKGELLIALGKFEEAIQVLSNGLKLNNTSSETILRSTRFKSPIDAFKCLNQLVGANIGLGEFESAEETARLIKDVLINSKNQFSNQSDIIAINKLWSETNDFLAQIYFQKLQLSEVYENQNAFFKAITLRKGSLINAKKQDEYAKHIYGIPDSIQLLENNVTARISSLRKQLAEVEAEKESKVVEELRDAQFQLEELQDNYEKNYLKYYNTRNEIKTVGLKDFQNKFGSDEISIHYAFIDTSLYIMTVTNNNLEVVLNEPGNTKSLVLEGRTALMNRADNFDVASKLLYVNLIDPIIESLTGKSRLEFYSDDVLNYFPLELLKNPQDEYLLEAYNISYGISPNLKKGGEYSLFSSNKLLSFAPDFTNQLQVETDVIRDELAAIPGAIDEVKYISEIYDGTSFLNKEATESNFRKNLSDHTIIHLATHAIVNDEFPEYSKLAFNLSDSIEDGYLHAYEIYSMNLNAKMVSLSACNTGFGSIQKGEGVMSLSHAFAYAGVPSTLVSLWPASDKSTPVIMKSFYSNLEAGMTKDEALREAKLSFLKDAKGKARHPFYWGGFILTGDTSEIEYDFTNLYWGFGIGLTLFILMLGLIRVRLSSS